ncbi:unnamed protein product [Thlaspi arvense]|uniref:DUF1985 domain-containing protein n=1 Tax=Thlaspi arvense TaxID=13288 RepID=A0AAU9RUL9_THLAR|nr:unnamed protein product [Thlaspi arvense]
MLGQTDKSTVKGLMDLLENNANRMSAKEKLSLGAAILTHGIIISKNPTVKISRENLQLFLNFDTYSLHPWGKIGYEVLSASIRMMQAKTFAKGQYEVQGFVWAITLWALSAVPALGTSFGSRFDSSSSAGPLCLQWKATRTPSILEVFCVEQINNILNMLVILTRKVKIIQQVLGIPEENEADGKRSEVSSHITPRFNLIYQDSLQNSINNDNGGDTSRHRADDKDNAEGIEANVTNSQ